MTSFGTASIATTDARCVARGCTYTGLNTNTKAAVGVCDKCGSFEHYVCSKTSNEDRDEILRGNQAYICTMCFMKDPSLVAFDPKTFNKNSICGEKTSTLNDSYYEYQPIAVADATAPNSPVKAIEYTRSCEKCEFASKDGKEFSEHEAECQGDRLQNDINNDEKQPSDSVGDLIPRAQDTDCPHCDEIFERREDLANHISEQHTNNCPLCQLSFTDLKEFASHLKEVHTPTCTTCEIKFTNKTEFEAHIRYNHGISNVAETVVTQEESTEVVSCLKCPLCEISVKTKDEL